MNRLLRLPLALLGLVIIGAASPPHSCTPGPYIVFFDWGSSAISKEAVAILDNAIETAGDCGPERIAIAGHTDTSEKPGISRDRAKGVANYFASRGIFAKRRFVEGYGARQPRIKTPPNTRELQNRRVHISYGPF